ncbi:hypothetical protein H0H92_001682 [Tricholoma furcatifolium]|nr:hypothetical protein H0H92_001682 [Tricholoma furcatifolium]
MPIPEPDMPSTVSRARSQLLQKNTEPPTARLSHWARFFKRSDGRGSFKSWSKRISGSFLRGKKGHLQGGPKHPGFGA